MTPTEMMVEDRRGTPSAGLTPLKWREFKEKTYECRVLLSPEEDGGYSAVALRLPGVVSQGNSLEEALDNIREAFAAAISIYLDEGRIPWTDVEVDRIKGWKERWILVNVQ